MSQQLTYYHRLLCLHLLLMVAINVSLGAPTQPVKPGLNPTTPSTTRTSRKTLLQTAPTSYPRPLDYDYHDFRQPASLQQPAAPRYRPGQHPSKSLGKEAITGQQLAPFDNWAVPLPGGNEHIWTDRYEWLRHQVRKLHRHGQHDQLDALQVKYPKVNLTMLYDHYSKGGLDYDNDGSQYLDHNGTYQWQPYYGDTDEGYWYNETYYPGEMEAPEMEAPEREDGYFYNGTWYAGMEDRDEGILYNGTYYPGEEDMEDQLERMRHKGMMSGQQQYYPGWKEAGANSVHNNKEPMYNQQQQLPIRNWEGQSGQLAPPLQQQQRQQPQQNIPGVPQRLPMVQQRPPPRRPTAFDRANLPNRPPQRPLQSNANPATQQLQGAPGKGGQPPTGVVNSGAGLGNNNNNNPGHAALTGKGPTKEQMHPSVVKSIPTAVSWGVVFAALLGASVVLAPLACLLYKYRQGKRIKKRTFLKRPEHGSVDDGILDALVMKELGEQKDARVKQVDQDWGRSWRGGGKSSFRTTYELKPLPTSTTSAHVHYEPSDSIT